MVQGLMVVVGVHLQGVADRHTVHVQITPQTVSIAVPKVSRLRRDHCRAVLQRLHGGNVLGQCTRAFQIGVVVSQS